MNKPVRRAELSVAYNSTDISTDIAPMLESFDYEDVVDGKTSDNIGIGVDNKDGRWYGDWLPDRGATLEATLTCRDWPGTKILKCGIFEIDDIDFGAVPNVCTISAVSVGISSAIRREEKTKPWESIDLRTIAAEIAGKHGFGLEYDSGINPQYERRDQREQTDLQFLISLLDDNGLAIEIADKKLLIYEQKKREQMAPSHTFKRNAGDYLGHSLRLPTCDVYCACEVLYMHPQQRSFIAHRFPAPPSRWSGKKPPVGKILKVRERCETFAQAELLSKAKLREENRREVEGGITFLGNPDIAAGTTARLEGFGKFDAGNYFIVRVRHSYDKGGGYETDVEFRGAIDY